MRDRKRILNSVLSTLTRIVNYEALSKANHVGYIVAHQVEQFAFYDLVCSNEDLLLTIVYI